MIRIRRSMRDRAERRPRFTDGLIVGALIGAAIAGSTLWSKLRRSSGADPSGPPDAAQPHEGRNPR